jgi:hypothetical protein
MSGEFYTSDEFVIFVAGAVVALFIMSVAIWAFIIDLHICAPAIIESTVKEIDDEHKLRPMKGHESDGEVTLIFDSDDEEEDDDSVSHYETV